MAGFSGVGKALEEADKQARAERRKKYLEDLRKDKVSGVKEEGKQSKKEEGKMEIKVNPEAKAMGEFGYAEAGEYEFRVDTTEDREGENSKYISNGYSFVDPNVKAVEEGKVIGKVFDNLMTREDIQGDLKSLAEAVGMDWADFNSGALVGMTFRAKVKVEPNNKTGALKNVIAKYIPAGA